MYKNQKSTIFVCTNEKRCMYKMKSVYDKILKNAIFVCTKIINKEFEINILLNTHSPYFLRAIQVYAARYYIADKCKYYLSEIEDGYAVVKDVSNDIDKIYAKLAQPIQTLSDLEAL